MTEDSDRARALWSLMDGLRGTHAVGMEILLEIAKQHPGSLSVGDVHLLARESRSSRSFSEWVCPEPIVKFISEYVSGRQVSSILDPWAGVGTLLLPLVAETGATSSVGVSRNRNASELARLLDHKHKTTWLCGEPLEELGKTSMAFDLVVSCPPFGLMPQRVTFTSPAGPVEVQDSQGHLAALSSCLRLADNGLGLFVVARGFVGAKGKNTVFANLARFGLGLKAYVAVPTGMFAPHTSIPSALVAIQRGESDKIFVGEMSGDADRNQSLLDNLGAGKEGKELASGRFVTADGFAGYDSLVAAERIERLARRLGLTSIALGDVAAAVNLTRATELPGFDESANAVYLPLIGRSDAVASLSELTMKPHNYAQLVVDPERADAGYVAGFLNTALGQAVREGCHSGAVIPKITKSSLERMRLFLPTRQIQIETTSADVQIGNLVNELQELRDQVWSRPHQLAGTQRQIARVNRDDRFVDWLDTLPFPLASVLWAYNAARGSVRLQYDYLGHFFEALAQFLATVLLSGFANDEELYAIELGEIRTVLKSNHLSLEMSTFGTWVRICERLSKKAREMLNGQDRLRCRQMFRTSDDDVLQAFLSSRLIGILQDANGLRNEWRGHGGAASDQLVRERAMVLQNHLNGVRGCLGDVFARYQLIMPRDMKLKEGIYQINAHTLMGTRMPFESVEFPTNDPLETDCLYLVGEEERSAMKLLPLLRIEASPESAQNACYFYNRKQKDGLRFISYHFDAQAEMVTPAPDTLRTIERIQGSPESIG